jgi:2-keto-4-pentenoate hydratase/2-oxohepta-3-ene-1,7-dioic acid hydratase in catechol pathway
VPTNARALRIGAALAAVLTGIGAGSAGPLDAQGGAVVRYVRYTVAQTTSFGILEGQTIREISAAPWDGGRPTNRTRRLAEVTLLAPVVPGKVIAVGLNFRSHLGTRAPATEPGLFAKYPSSVIGPDAEIRYPADATNLHYEGEMVIVIGKRASNVSKEAAPQHIFGVTAGNDVSERDWQAKDLQWFRAKASDTFGPIGPMVVTGLDYNDLLLQTRLNGEVVQSERTKDLIFDVSTIVSYISRYITLEPGDVIFTGTPQTTRAMKPGDVVEIEVEGVGVLRNRVVSAK